ncbi:hypothetical protein K469DRAFT_756269 [Zopfia rhizophila CBS 207.26]|uniref:Uncharacterized protein n=1 Tax=Zopfia rhizophila CBS 207.26 TaxID=1314779 RepID=A0A6A6DCK0_9PEZI|nr:hypothetical protein K469DRAFT_756269 [Zopfia rhizophila CBS 207.26]
MVLDENEQIRAKLERYPDAKLGFVVYRCAYKDDAEWNQFMEYLNTHTRHNLESGGIGDLYSRLDWNVQQDLSLDGASKKKVREEFRKWINEEHEINLGMPRHRACVMADQDSVESVVKDPMPPEEHDMFGVKWVRLISRYDEDPESDDDEELELFDPSRPLDEQRGDDEEEEDVETPPPPKDEVSSTRVGLSYLVPRVYSLLEAPGWHSFARKDGRAARP